MSQTIQVHTTLQGQDVQAGTIFAQNNRITFRYTPEFLASDNAYDLTPALPRVSDAPFFFEGLGPFSDSAPDRWGRKLLNRALKRKRVSEIEYLLGVDDATRQGALRYYIDGTPQASGNDIPKLTDLPKLLDTADAVGEDREVADIDLCRLYRATGSLGGARPKACIYDKDMLWLAKFPKPSGDEWVIIGWEAVTLQLADMAGIRVPNHHTISITDSQDRHRSVLLTSRFDRQPSKEGPSFMTRIPYYSAMTALDAHDGEGGDWLDLAEFARSMGCDLHELWRRAMFGAAIGNCDDHLRNHGFIRKDSTWELSPAFDLNPEPYDENLSDEHQLTLFGDGQVTPELLMRKDALALFDIPTSAAISYTEKLRSTLSQALSLARKTRIDSHSLAIMSGRFQHGLETLGCLV